MEKYNLLYKSLDAFQIVATVFVLPGIHAGKCINKNPLCFSQYLLKENIRLKPLQ